MVGSFPTTRPFLVFSDYARNAVRMSALLPVRNIHVYTHDSIGLGEDGPTHQPVEHVASLRLIPGLQVWRPCDTVESAVAWKAALENRRRRRPWCLRARACRISRDPPHSLKTWRGEAIC